MALAVLTRDPADVEPYARALARLGLTVLAMPVTRIERAPDPDALARAVRGGVYDAVVVMSMRAAHELVAAVGTRRPALGDVWAVGPATRRVLDAAGLAARTAPDPRDGVDLARHLVGADVRGKRILVPRAEEGRTEPLEVLREAGADVVDVVAYRTVACGPEDPAVAAGLDALASGQVEVLGVFAPSQVAALVALVRSRGLDPAALRTRTCAIGETTAQALRQAGIEHVAVAPAPTPEGMAQAASSVYPPKA